MALPAQSVPWPRRTGRPGRSTTRGQTHALDGPLLAADAPAQLLPARQLMVFTLASHIVLVPMGVALPFLTLLMHHRGLRRDDPAALPLARRWSAVIAV